MMGFFRFAERQIMAVLTSADTVGFLCAIRKMGIPIEHITSESDLVIRFSVLHRDWERMSRLAEKRGDELVQIGKTGLLWNTNSWGRRWLLVIGSAIILGLSTLLPRYVLIVSVEGNYAVPEQMILEVASECGISFGSARREIRNEEIKNRMLARVPQLQWVGVNTYGCCAVITVRERQTEIVTPDPHGISNLVAARDGYVVSVTAERGIPLCRIGQAVTRGQVLISGYLDNGLLISGTNAQGEVFAATSRDLEVTTPIYGYNIMSFGDQCRKFSLLIGKKRINFYKGSGISGGSCAKMYKKYVLTLPGGFELPVSLIVETETDRDLQAAIVPKEDAWEFMFRFSQHHLTEQMLAGTITDQRLVMEQEDGVYRMTGCYACEEMVGRRQEELIGEYHGKSDGANRERRSGG